MATNTTRAKALARFAALSERDDVTPYARGLIDATTRYLSMLIAVRINLACNDIEKAIRNKDYTR